MKYILNVLSFITLVLTSILCFYGLYLTYAPIQVYVFHSLKTNEQVIKRGDNLHYVVSFDKLENRKCAVSFYLVDEIILPLEGSVPYHPAGKYSIHDSRTIPTTILPGVYKLRIENDCELTPLRHLLYVWDSNMFTVK